jgi:hypothetical protein
MFLTAQRESMYRIARYSFTMAASFYLALTVHSIALPAEGQRLPDVQAGTPVTAAQAAAERSRQK